MKADFVLTARLLGQLAVTAVPAVAASLYVVRRGASAVWIVIAVALAASGLVACAAFVVYYIDPGLGSVWDLVVLLGCIAVGVSSWRSPSLRRSQLVPLIQPFLLWAIGSCFVTFLGFLHGGIGQGEAISALRFSGPLPSDNDIPRFFTEWIASHGHSGTPPAYFGGWLLSDRPPLQIGYALSQHVFSDSAGEPSYQLLGIAIQQFWIMGMWAALTAAQISRRARALAMAATMISDVAIVHGFFVWPKLLPAAFLLAAFAIIISPDWSEHRRDVRVGALVAGLVTLAMLAHGASIFGVIPLIFLAAYRGLPSRRWIVVGLIVGIGLYAPWSAYQKYADPPGNRVVKWQFGGVFELNDEGTAEAIETGYREAGLGGALRNKVRNFGEMVGVPQVPNDATAAVDDIEAGSPGLALAQLRKARFFSLLPFLGLFLIGPVAMLAALRRRRNDSEWSFAVTTFGFLAVAVVCWGLLLFGGPDSVASIHVGSLAIPLLAVSACVVGLHSVYPRLAAGLVALNVALVLIVYTPSLNPPSGSAYSPLMAVFALISLVALFAALFGGASASSVFSASGLRGNIDR